MYVLEGLDCANCAAKLERSIGKINGVTAATVNFMTLKLALEYDAARADEVISALETVVKKQDSKIKMRKA